MEARLAGAKKAELRGPRAEEVRGPGAGLFWASVSPGGKLIFQGFMDTALINREIIS